MGAISSRRREIYKDIDSHLSSKKGSSVGSKVAKGISIPFQKIVDSGILDSIATAFHKPKKEDVIDPSLLHDIDGTEVPRDVVEDDLASSGPVLQAHHFAAVDANLPSGPTRPIDEDPVETYDDPVDKVPYEPKEPWYSRLFSFSRYEDDVDDVELESPMDDLMKDLRDVSRLSLTILQKLDSEAVSKFKDSEEFLQYKEILKRHNVIR